jgi:predicted dehydrogenase
VLAQAGRIEIRSGGHDIRLFRAQPSRLYSGYTELAPDDRPLGTMRDLMLHAVEDLVAAVAEGREPLCSGADGLAALRIAEAARKGAATGSRIDLSGGALVE